MAALIHCRHITLGFGGKPLVEQADLVIEPKDRVCLIGRNGVGKSTFLKFLYGQVDADAGAVEQDPTLKMAMLQQTVPEGVEQSVADVVAAGLETQMESWQREHLVAKVLTQMHLSPNALFSELSGGLKRRVLLAQALVTDPDILLLDEPTNHLDIDAIIWLENFLLNYNKTIIFITHDRVLMRSLANHIVEIDNGRLISMRTSYDNYLKHKEHSLHAEEKANALFDKRLAQEEVWIRQGIKARRTRNEGRVRALKKMREERAQRRVRPGDVSFSHHKLEQSGKIVFEAEKVDYAYDQKDIIKNFSTVVVRGDKVGIIGANGSGKTTLLHLLLAKLNPTAGKIKQGTNVSVAYFDQQQMALDESKNVLENVGGGSDQVTIGGKTKHIISYLQDFLFSPDRARQSVKVLSGGERNRVMLAKLFVQPANVLVLDEPTNDLDIETLELLEEQLTSFQGTLLLVSHDRAFLNNIVTSTLVMEPNGHVGDYVGGYDDWLRQRKPESVEKVVKKPKTKPKAKPRPKSNELKNITNKIERLEVEQQRLHDLMCEDGFYDKPEDEVAKVQEQLKQVEIDLQSALERWEDLES